MWRKFLTNRLWRYDHIIKAEKCRLWVQIEMKWWLEVRVHHHLSNNLCGAHFGPEHFGPRTLDGYLRKIFINHDHMIAIGFDSYRLFDGIVKIHIQRVPLDRYCMMSLWIIISLFETINGWMWSTHDRQWWIMVFVGSYQAHSGIVTAAPHHYHMPVWKNPRWHVRKDNRQIAFNNRVPVEMSPPMCNFQPEFLRQIIHEVGIQLVVSL